MNSEIRINIADQIHSFIALEREHISETLFGKIRRECGSRLEKSLTTAAKIAGYTALELSVDLTLVTTFLALDTDWNMRNPTLLSASEVCYRYIARPTMSIREFVFEYTPEITLREQHLSKVFIGVLVEECVFRGLIQRALLPTISKILPKRCSEFFNDKMTRVALSAILFSLAHQANMYSPMGIWPQLIGGIFYGAIAEKENSLFIPTMTHFFSNIFFGVGETKIPPF